VSSFISNHVLTSTLTVFSKINGMFHKKKKIIENYVISELSDTGILQSSFKHNSTSENHNSWANIP